MGHTLVITGHGNYATGMQSTIEVIAGKHSGISYLDFTAEHSGEEFKKQMKALLDQHKGETTMIICDLVGGTPFKAAVELTADNKEIEVVAGCNLGSIIEAILQRSTVTLEEMAIAIVESTARSCARFVKCEVAIQQNHVSADGI